jgi:type IV pilus assembly protein PilW
MQAKVQPVTLNRQRGLLLAELLLAALISTFLIIGLVQIVTAARSSFRLQENEAEVQENGRHAVSVLSALIRQSGFSPEPWNESFDSPSLLAETQDRLSSRSDRLAIRSWSNLNCFDNRNLVEDGSGEPVFYIRESVFDLNDRRDLTHTCRYGPTATELVTQIRREGFIRNVEFFQAIYGEDSDRDGNIDRWVRGGEWLDEGRVLGVRLGLILGSTEVVTEQIAQKFSILDLEYSSSADGKLHRLFEFASAIRRRSG